MMASPIAIPLTKIQNDIIAECMQRSRGCLSVPMGTGKTVISIELGLRQTDQPLLVVCSKTLLGGWISEVDKFYKGGLKYEICHTESLKKKKGWVPAPDTRLVLTTPETLTKVYREHHLQSVTEEYYNPNDNPFVVAKRYVDALQPLIYNGKGAASLYSRSWGSLIVDEIQEHTNIETFKCRAIGAIHSVNRWALSGTAFPEPKVQRILGYYYILGLEGPRSLPLMEEYIRSKHFPGLMKTMVWRDDNPDFIPPKLQEVIINHHLSEEEAKVYTGMKGIMKRLALKVREYREQNDVENTRLFSSYCLAMITYFRQAIVCPLIPISSAAVDIADSTNKSELSQIMIDEIKQMELAEWLDDPDSIRSTRIKKILEVIEKHRNERIVLFGCYTSCINVIRMYLKDYNVFAIESSMSIEKRAEEIKRFSESSNGVLCLTYKLASCGLNLQAATTVILSDFAWNRDTTKQAIARILRRGQEASIINVIMFTSNTVMEKALLQKQQSKLLVYQDLKTGSTKKKISSIKLNKIIGLLENEENDTLLREVQALKI